MTIQFFLFLSQPAFAQASKIFAAKAGKISFQSNAQFETIKAASNQLQGLFDIGKRQFAFRVRMKSFEGFNSALQKEHFNENYIESDKYPEATFSGKIIEDVDFEEDGLYNVRAKGNFDIHGVPQERTIKCEIVVKNKIILVKAVFNVLLSDHNITIPKVVKDKLSSDIKVQVSCRLEAR